MIVQIRRALTLLILLGAGPVGAIPIPPPPAEVDITGIWQAEGSASFEDVQKGGVSCSYAGAVEFQQTGSSVTGQSVIGLVSGDGSCPSLAGPLSGTVSGNTVDFLIGGAVKGVGVEFCGQVLGDSMSGDWVSPPPFPCFILKDLKGTILVGTFTGERIPPGVPTLSLTGLAVLALLLALPGIAFAWRYARG